MTRKWLISAVYFVALPFGVMQRELAAVYRTCMRSNPLWLPVTALLVPLVLVFWALNRLTFAVLYRGMVALARQHA